jgi:hypothetical protein
MRRRLAPFLIVAIGVCALAATAVSAKNARLQGTFDVKVTTIASDVPKAPPGSTDTRTYKFRPLCHEGACAKVKFTREAGSGRYTSKLHKTAPGVYEGSETPRSYLCTGGATGEIDTQLTVKITRKKDGKATKISGSLHFDFTGCPETFQDATFSGKKKRG